MRILAFLLSFVVLWMSVVPCCEAQSHAEIFDTDCASTHQDPCQDGEAELPCSPFFTCGACVGCLVSKDFHFDSHSPHNLESYELIDFRDDLTLGNKISLLKPPKNFFT